MASEMEVEFEGEEENEVAETGVDSQVHMACVMQGRRVGVAYYDSNTRRLFVLEIWEDSAGGFPLIDLVKYQSKPITIYASTKTEEALLLALQRNDTNDKAPVVKLMKSSTFSYEQAWHRLPALLLFTKPGTSFNALRTVLSVPYSM